MAVPRGVIAMAVLASSIAVAEPHRAAPVITPIEHVEHDAVARVLYLNRCVGGCVVHKGDANDAADSVSTIPLGAGSDFTLGAFAGTDDDWQQIVQCVKDVYSPFAVTVTDQPPSGAYDEAMVAGLPMDLGEPSDVLGIAPLAADCSAQSNAISFTFANAHPAIGFVDNVCWTASQESSHVYGLDHEYQYTDGSSACNDPMTYRTECGVGEKFFRDKEADCGEYATRKCKCSATQNSALQLTGVFGTATPSTAAPTVTLTSPQNGATVAADAAVHAAAYAQRGVGSVTLLLNGYPWVTAAGTAFTASGSMATDYPLIFPDSVPDGVIDVQVSAADDLGIATLSTIATVTKGAPCSSAATCLTGQSCDSGKCEWPTPSAELGDTCAFPQACISGHCDDSMCTQPCTVSGASANGCPANYTCTGDGSGGAACEPSGGGCCSAGDHGPGELGLGVFVALSLLRRRRFQ